MTTYLLKIVLLLTVNSLHLAFSCLVSEIEFEYDQDSNEILGLDDNLLKKQLHTLVRISIF